MSERLSEHFTREEWACKGSACCWHSCPTPTAALLDALEELRAAVGGPLHVNCGYRCDRHNAETPGARVGSTHTRNLAADVSAPGKSGRELAFLAEGVEAFRHGGIGTYPDRIHVDIGPQRRWEVK
jgi:uncharacterized protein YcbK (DUF882 family)